jgi:hypothetical protein
MAPTFTLCAQGAHFTFGVSSVQPMTRDTLLSLRATHSSNFKGPFPSTTTAGPFLFACRADRSSPADGCAEAVLLADGFSIDQLAGLVVGRYAVMQRRRVEISGPERTVVWVQITEAGRRAIAE